MKVRCHRGSLDEAMKTLATIDRTREALRAYLGEHSGICFPPGFTLDVKRYCFDERTGWDTYIVIADGFPVAWTDGPVPK
jgi:hypothetical protein